MTAAQLVANLAARGVRLVPAGDTFTARARPGLLTDRDKAELTRLKPDIIALLVAPQRLTWQQELQLPEVQALIWNLF